MEGKNPCEIAQWSYEVLPFTTSAFSLLKGVCILRHHRGLEYIVLYHMSVQYKYFVKITNLIS